MRTLFVTLFCVIFQLGDGSVHQELHLTYKVVGTAKGLPDNTMLYLDDLSSGVSSQLMDSASSLNGHFQFSGTLKDSLVRVSIRTADGKESVTFWMEASPIQITIVRNDFESVRITGSKTQADLDELDSVLREKALKKENLLNVLKSKSLERDRYDISNYIKEVEKSELSKISTFIRSNRNSIIGAEMLRTYLVSFNRTTVFDLYDDLSADVKNCRAGKDIRDNYLYSSNKVKVGDRYIDFAEPDTTGNMIQFSQVHEDLILLEFWASGCGGCRMENPELVRIYKEYKDKGFEILAVSLDRKKADWTRAIKKDRLPWKHVSDLRFMRNDAAVKYGVMSIPYNFLINKDGIVIGKDLRGPDLRRTLEELLN